MHEISVFISVLADVKTNQNKNNLTVRQYQQSHFIMLKVQQKIRISKILALIIISIVGYFYQPKSTYHCISEMYYDACACQTLKSRHLGSTLHNMLSVTKAQEHFKSLMRTFQLNGRGRKFDFTNVVHAWMDFTYQ